MHDSQRYRIIAGECLLAARECQPCYRKLHLSMAASWLSLARQDEAMDGVLAIWGTASSPKSNTARAVEGRPDRKGSHG
jgi:hypothetical protein